MNTKKTRASLPAEIFDYLDNHPDIFVQHPELLSRLDIPHVAGKNVASLIEYQVIRLRQELDELRHSVTGLEFNTGYHRKLIGNIHALSLELHAAQTVQKLYNILRRDLKTYYAADRVLLLIFSGTRNTNNHAGLMFYNSSSSLRYMFSELFTRRQPLCGSLQEEHLQALFGSNSETVKSTVLLPYACDNWQELLVLGSHTDNRYGHGLELDLLMFINDIICRAMPSWLLE